jgi:hypothetical protein
LRRRPLIVFDSVEALTAEFSSSFSKLSVSTSSLLSNDSSSVIDVVVGAVDSTTGVESLAGVDHSSTAGSLEASQPVVDVVVGAFQASVVDEGASHSFEAVFEILLFSFNVGTGSSTLGFDLIFLF